MSKYGRPQKYYALADITLLRFDVRAYVPIHAAYATSTREKGSKRYGNRDVEVFCSTPRVPWLQQPARQRIKVIQPAYSQGPPKRGSLTVTLLYADHLRG